jgi:hypothetical protein
MDTDSARSLVEQHLERMSSTTVLNEDSAHQALALALAAVGVINQGLGSANEAILGTASPADGILERLEDWIKRLVAKLTEIVKQLANGTSFSISVGTGVSVTVNFPSPS